MVPFGPAEAVMVKNCSSPTAKSLKEVTPPAWALVGVRAPMVAADQLGASNFLTMNAAGFAPASTSAAGKVRPTVQLSKATP